MAKKTKTAEETTKQLEAMFADEPGEESETNAAVLAEAPEETAADENSKPGRPAKYEGFLRLRYRNASRTKARALGGTWEVRGDDYWIIPGADQGEPFLFTYEEFKVEYADKQAAKAAKVAEATSQPEEAEETGEAELITT